MDTKLRARTKAVSNSTFVNRSGSMAPSTAPSINRTRTPARGMREEEEAMRARVEYRALQPGLRQLCGLEAPPETVLENILTDAKPHTGRACLQLQYLWPDISGRCSTLQVEYMPRPEDRLLEMHKAARVIARLWRSCDRNTMHAIEAMTSQIPSVVNEHESCPDAAADDLHSNLVVHESHA